MRKILYMYRYITYLIHLNANLSKPSNIENREYFKLEPLAEVFVFH